MADETVILCV